MTGLASATLPQITMSAPFSSALTMPRAPRYAFAETTACCGFKRSRAFFGKVTELLFESKCGGASPCFSRRSFTVLRKSSPEIQATQRSLMLFSFSWSCWLAIWTSVFQTGWPSNHFDDFLRQRFGIERPSIEHDFDALFRENLSTLCDPI